MLAAQLLDRAELAHSRTLGILRSFSRRGRDFDGASSAATKASYCLALSRNSRRSASVSAAAAKPLSRIKALTVLRSTDAARFSSISPVQCTDRDDGTDRQARGRSPSERQVGSHRRVSSRTLALAHVVLE